MNTKHQHMRSLWKAQRRFYQHWYEQLYLQAIQIKQHFAQVYGLTHETWTERELKVEKPYIYLLNLDDNQFSEAIYDHVTTEGEFLFKLVVVVDHSKDSYPKALLSIPMAIRFVEQTLQYGMFCTEEKKVKEDFGWYKSLEDYEQEISSLIEQDLAFDPMLGFEKKSRIGFI